MYSEVVFYFKYMAVPFLEPVGPVNPFGVVAAGNVHCYHFKCTTTKRYNSIMKTIPAQNAEPGIQMFPAAKRRNEGVKTIITTLTNHPRKNRVRRDNYENMVCPLPKIEGFLSAVKIRAFFDYFVEEIAQMMMERSIKQCYCYHASKKSKQTFFFDLNAETKITITIEEK